jgi:1-acyl-sn-glycerol-3-phosphate acyltransferase
MVLIGNHQSALDLAVIGSMCPSGTVIVGKKEIAWIPIFGWYFRAAGNLMLNRSNASDARQALKKTAERVRQDQLNVAIFPEGTRNRKPSTGFLPFKKGAFHLARELQVPILPVVCSSLEGIALWESLQLDGGKVIVSLLEPIPTQGWTEAQMNSEIPRIHALMLAEYHRINALAAAR